MSNPSLEIDSLYKLTLNKLCSSLNEQTLQHLLQWYPPSIIMEVLWKVLHINEDNEKFVYGHMEESGELSSVKRGRNLAQMSLQLMGHSPVSFRQMSSETHEQFAKTQETKFVNTCNFSKYFDLDLFFKLVEITERRNQLFTIFQVCLQIRGYEFPKTFAEEWINNETQKYVSNDLIFHRIEQGLKLGIFLGDAGWLNESASVLSYTYTLITTKWNCHNKNLKLIKIIQCLTKWLLVVSNYHDFIKAKIVLKHMLHNIEILEKTEERKLCISYAYVAVSQYYCVLMEFNEAWSWAVKAVNELHDTSGDILKLLVISHVIKVCSVLNKLTTAKKMIDQLHLYDKEIDQNIYVDMLLNEACYSLKADLAKDSIFSYYTALDLRRNLFGYYNLHTAMVFVDYAYARYVCDYSTTDFHEAMRSILQGIFIMKKIGVPDDNMLFVNAGRIKALILEEKAIDIMDRGIDLFIQDNVQEGIKRLLEKMKKNMLIEAEVLHSKALEVSIKAVGENALLTAKSYCNLGRLYQSQEKYEQSEAMHLKAIEIKESILGKDNPEVALSLGHLASLYTYQMKRYREAETLYLRSKTIYETTYGRQYTGLLYDFQGLREVYYKLDDIEMLNQYTDYIVWFHEARQVWLNKIHTAFDENCTKDDLSLEKFKCILNECICEN